MSNRIGFLCQIDNRHLEYHPPTTSWKGIKGGDFRPLRPTPHPTRIAFNSSTTLQQPNPTTPTDFNTRRTDTSQHALHHRPPPRGPLDHHRGVASCASRLQRFELGPRVSAVQLRVRLVLPVHLLLGLSRAGMHRTPQVPTVLGQWPVLWYVIHGRLHRVQGSR
jgi:hypothetical protein